MFDRSRRLAFLTLVTVGVTACGGGGGSPPGTPAPTPTATGTGTVPQSVYTCSSSDTPSVALRASSAGARRHVARTTVSLAAPAYTGLLAVTYSRSYARGSHELLASRERTNGASFLSEIDHPYANLTTRIVAVPQAQRASTEARLRAQPGVTGVSMTGTRHYASSVQTGLFTNDPYFNGFSTTLSSSGVTPPGTYRMGPYEESADVPGQWDMHAIGLEKAFAYSISNGSGVVNANAVGSSAVKLAVIDSGQDTNNDDLGSKIAYQKCFLTNPSGAQSTSNFTTDQDGHGTIVSGIAGAAFQNGTGFVGAGGAVSIYGYRVNPTPDDNCSDPTKALNDNQCGSDSRDIAVAIEDAIAQHVNVINLSLGANACTNGQDPDATEGNAIADAIKANIVVVAASGNGAKNGTSKGVSSPACDPGVIAAGASALDDGQTNATGHTGGSATKQIEYVAGYSDFGNPASSVHDPNAWGIVAPGGDASSSSDADDFHWIENVWTTTPFMANASDTSFQGECAADYPDGSGVTVSNNCRTLINGTSMSTPIVAGAAALIIAANPAYQSPSAMKRLLCQTADDIGDAHEGCGRLNVYRAMAKALNDPNPP